MIRQPGDSEGQAFAHGASLAPGQGVCARRFCATVATVLVCASTAFAGGGDWLNLSGGMWSTGSNWSSGSAPTSIDNVTFNLNSTYMVGFTSNGVASNFNMNAGTVTLSLAGRTLNAGGVLQLAASSGQSAALTMLGGSVSLGGGPYNIVGGASGATGVLSLSNASLTTTQTPVIGYNGGVGSLLLDLAGQLNSGSWTIVGTVGGSGTLSVVGGSSVRSLTQHVVGWGGTGYNIVSGTDSQISTINGMIDVGDNGVGTLVIQNNAVASSGGITSIGHGSDNGGGAGSLLITSGGQLNSGSNLNIGWNGGRGYASISGPGSGVDVQGYVVAGESGLGTLVVQNSATLSTDDLAVIGYGGGSGSLLIQSGGQLTSGSSTAIGWNGGVGNAVVTGTNSTLHAVGIFDIGEAGSGTLSIQSGGLASTDSNAHIGLGGGAGRVFVTGTNSRLLVAGSAFIGNSGLGSLSISNNARVSVAGTLRVHSGGSVSLASGATLEVGTLDLTANPARLNWTGGTLRINTSAPAIDGLLTVPSSGTLGGVGSIARPVVVSPNGTLAPGNSAGMLSFTNHLTLETSGSDHAALDVELGGDPSIPANFGVTFDVVHVSGAGKVFTVGGATLRVTPQPTAVINQAYQIVKVSGGASVNFSSMFSNLVDGTTYDSGQIDYTVFYDADDGIFVTFTRVPEPASLGWVGAAVILLKRRGRR